MAKAPMKHTVRTKSLPTILVKGKPTTPPAKPPRKQRPEGTTILQIQGTNVREQKLYFMFDYPVFKDRSEQHLIQYIESTIARWFNMTDRTNPFSKKNENGEEAVVTSVAVRNLFNMKVCKAHGSNKTIESYYDLWRAAEDEVNRWAALNFSPADANMLTRFITNTEFAKFRELLASLCSSIATTHLSSFRSACCDKGILSRRAVLWSQRCNTVQHTIDTIGSDAIGAAVLGMYYFGQMPFVTLNNTINASGLQSPTIPLIAEVEHRF